jgi:hypothetical protein
MALSPSSAVLERASKARLDLTSGEEAWMTKSNLTCLVHAKDASSKAFS